MYNKIYKLPIIMSAAYSGFGYRQVFTDTFRMSDYFFQDCF